MKNLTILVLFLCLSAPAMAADPCTNLDRKTLSLDANGFLGITGEIILQGPQNGTYSFQTHVQFQGEPADQVTGTCKDRHIVFTRTRNGVFVQEYDGWIFMKNQWAMAGVFNHNNSPKQYGWCGKLDPVIK